MIAFFDKFVKVKSTKTSKIHAEFAYFAPFLRVLLIFIKFTPLMKSTPRATGGYFILVVLTASESTSVAPGSAC